MNAQEFMVTKWRCESCHGTKFVKLDIHAISPGHSPRYSVCLECGRIVQESEVESIGPGHPDYEALPQALWQHPLYVTWHLHPNDVKFEVAQNWLSEGERTEVACKSEDGEAIFSLKK